MRTTILAFLVLTQATIGSAAAACMGSNLAVTSVAIQGVEKSQYLNNYRVVGTVTNVGSQTQGGDVLQFLDVNQYGHRLDDRGIPPLAPGQSYTVSYIWKRSVDAGQGTTPLSLHLRSISGTTLGTDTCDIATASRSILF